MIIGTCLECLCINPALTLFILWRGSTYHTFYKIRCLSWCSGSVNHSPSSSSVISLYFVYVVSEILCTVTGYSKQRANHVPLVARVVLLERVICFPCLSEHRHQPIPALHIPCTACNITFISMICHFRCCPRLFLHGWRLA